MNNTFLDIEKKNLFVNDVTCACTFGGEGQNMLHVNNITILGSEKHLWLVRMISHMCLYIWWWGKFHRHIVKLCPD